MRIPTDVAVKWEIGGIGEVGGGPPSFSQKIGEIGDVSEDFRRFSPIAPALARSVTSVRILTDRADLAHFWRDRRNRRGFSPILTDVAYFR